MTVEKTLNERGNRYGEFKDHAHISQSIKQIIQSNQSFNDMESYQKEALEMIAHKIARIINGDSDYIDSWHDISGYATLVVNELSKNNAEW